jgi:thiosulfate/3-mercaptopyruvate sulfurtransferase
MTSKKILISADDLLSQLDDADWIAVDCRFNLADPTAGRSAYEKAHIPGAVYFDLDLDLAAPVEEHTGRHPLPDADVFARLLGGAGISNEHHVVVYDGGNGAVASRAWWLLRWLGHDRVRLLDGGFAQWQARGLPTESGVTAREPAVFRGKVRPELVLTTEELARDVSAIAAMNLLDARDGARFRGEIEPLDPVAGHIPGAKSVPLGDFVNADGTWRSLAERESLLLEALDGKRDADWSVMCGSGVTACHLAISGLEAGLREPRIYVGSWSEWIRDEGRPVAREAE